MWISRLFGVTRVAVLVILFGAVVASAQSTAPMDSASKKILYPDTTKPADVPRDATGTPLPPRDTLIGRDSLGHLIYSPIRALGSIRGDTLATQRTRFDNTVNETFDLVERDPHAYPLRFGAPGQNNELLLDGLDTRNIAVMFAGRPLNNPITGRYSFLQIAPEFSETIEVLRGPRAAIFGFNATDAAINFVPQITNINRPYLRVRYYQSAFEHIASDLAFSENIAPAVNFNFAIDRESQIGEFANQGLQYWNLRGSVRWFADSSFNLLLKENFTHNHEGLNGGLVLKDLYASNVTAGVQLPVADGDEVRHDLTLTALYRDPDDTMLVTHASAYISTLRQEYQAHPDLSGKNPAFPFSLANEANVARWYGVDVRQEAGGEKNKLMGGVSVQFPVADASANLPAYSEMNAGLFGQWEHKFGKSLWFGLFGRGDLIASTFRPTLGAEANYSIGLGWSMVVNYVHTTRPPTHQEQQWVIPFFRGLGYALPVGDNPTVQNEIHSVWSGGLHWRSEPAQLDIDVSSRTITNPVIAVLQDTIYVLAQRDARSISTLSTHFKLHFGNFILDGSGLVTVDQTAGVQQRNVPVFYGHGGFYYHTPHLFGVPLELQTGFEGAAMSAYNGQLYLPSAQLFVPMPAAQAVQSVADATVDWVLTAHIGAAFIRMGIRNILDRRMYYTPYYPTEGIAFYLGVTWVLFD